MKPSALDRWTETEEAFLLRHYGTIGVKQIQRQLPHRSANAIRLKMFRLRSEVKYFSGCELQGVA